MVRGASSILLFKTCDTKEELDFKVKVGLNHSIYAKDSQGQIRREYVPKKLREIISDENAKLNGQVPIAAINADYIGTDNQPQGLNISRGIEYSGDFKDRRSSFGISGGQANQRMATIQIGRRKDDFLNYNIVGGNGRWVHPSFAIRKNTQTYIPHDKMYYVIITNSL